MKPILDDEAASLRIESSSSLGVGYDFEICEVDDQGETGRRAIVYFDESGELFIACFYRNIIDQSTLSGLSLTEEQAYEIVQNEIQNKTIGGELPGNSGAYSAQIKSSSSELRIWNGKEVYEFSIIADVEFETRSKIQKEYNIEFYCRQQEYWIISNNHDIAII